MSRNRIPRTKAMEDQIVAGMVRGESTETMAATFGVSSGTMKRWRRELKGLVPAARRCAIEAHGSKSRKPTRDELVAARDAVDADDVPGYHAASLALARHDDPWLDSVLTNGCGIVQALATSGEDRVLLITKPEDFAELAEWVTGEPDGEKAPGESDEAYARYLAHLPARNRRRAIDLLSRALEIVRASG